MSASNITPAIEEYLEAIYRLTSEGQPLPLADLAEHLDISPVSANEMVRKMVRKRLVSYEPYKGVALTAEGFEMAEGTVRRHRLWERFLTDVLRLPWDQVHDEACRLEHATSDTVEGRLAAFLDQPSTCPHGQPMPGEQAPPLKVGPLTELGLNRSGRIVAVANEDAEFLQALGRIGIRLEASVQVIEAEPAIQVITVLIDGRPALITETIAKQIMVVPSQEGERAGQPSPSTTP